MKSFYAVLVVLAIAGVGTLAYMASSGPAAVVTVPADLLPGEAAGYVMGSPDAKVEITEFGDFECGHCADFATVTEPDVVERLVNTGLARFRYVDFPLPGQPHSLSAHVAAACADGQGRFWPMHDKLFRGQNEWNYLGGSRNPKKEFEGYAREIGLDMGEWEKCYDDREPLPRILANRAEGEKLGVSSTPTILVNNLRLQDRPSYDRLKQLVDSIIAASPPAASGGK